jgi:hypothetical protein
MDNNTERLSGEFPGESPEKDINQYTDESSKKYIKTGIRALRMRTNEPSSDLSNDSSTDSYNEALDGLIQRIKNGRPEYIRNVIGGISDPLGEAILCAVKFNRFDLVKILYLEGNFPCSLAAIEMACQVGDLDVLEFFHIWNEIPRDFEVITEHHSVRQFMHSIGYK